MQIDSSTIGVIFAAFVGYLGWLGKQIFDRNACLKRLEQKLDSFIKFHTDKDP